MRVFLLVPLALMLSGCLNLLQGGVLKPDGQFTFTSIVKVDATMIDGEEVTVEGTCNSLTAAEQPNIKQESRYYFEDGYLVCHTSLAGQIADFNTAAYKDSPDAPFLTVTKTATDQYSITVDSTYVPETEGKTAEEIEMENQMMAMMLADSNYVAYISAPTIVSTTGRIDNDGDSYFEIPFSILLQGQPAIFTTVVSLK